MALHPVFVHFHTGILTATAALAIFMLIMRLVFREGIRTPGTRMAKVFHEFDIFIYWGSIIGLIGLVAGAVTGFMDWPMEALIDDPYMRFKILWSAVTSQIYVFLIFIRTKLGDKVWDSTSGFLIYGILVIVGGALMMIMGAMGGIAVYNTSILSPILDFLGLPWP
ncbi:MAG: hypothetical protein KAQ65_00360 [Candidatus Thorarchaeota archaeon]|nr:hypothetical protein [Candidatus Thorarchaeota archaeon]MCK5238974.1 hypothetical protein [Candidatus Thorarchaeota archaeon]